MCPEFESGYDELEELEIDENDSEFEDDDEIQESSGEFGGSESFDDCESDDDF